MKESRAGLFFGCFLRSYLVAAAYNPRGLQNIGFLYAIEPALAKLYGPGERLRTARLRYASNYNCHPFFTPLLLGVLLRMETSIAEDRLEPAALTNLKDITANALSALGDSLFNGTLLATWGLSAACLILAGIPKAALLMTIAGFVLLQIFKFATFFMGLRKGMELVFFLRRINIINLADYFKSANAALLTVFLWLALPQAPVSAWSGVLLYFLLAGYLVGRTHAPRVILALILLTATVASHFSSLFGDIPAFLTSF